DIGEQANQETARLIEQEGGRALAVCCDVTKGDDVKAAVEKTRRTFGRLDFAFNNAGLEPKKPAPTADYDEEEWNRIIDIDLRGADRKNGSAGGNREHGSLAVFGGGWLRYWSRARGGRRPNGRLISQQWSSNKGLAAVSFNRKP